MPAIKKLTGRAAGLGKIVEIREMTVGQWMRFRKENPEKEDATEADNMQRSLDMLAMMLYVDGAPIGAERLENIGMGEMQDAMQSMNSLMGYSEGDEGNG